MSRQAAEATAAQALTVRADRGYFSGPEVLACEQAGITAVRPKPLTSDAKADGRFDKQDFVCDPETDTYCCPCGRGADPTLLQPRIRLTLHGYAAPASRFRSRW